MKEKRNAVKNIWIKYSSKNKGFPVITAFLLGLVCVQIFKVTGVISFEFVLPYLILIFFMYGLLHKCWIVGICQKWICSGEKGLKFAAGAAAVTAVQGVLAEGALKIGNTIALITAVILMLVLYLYIWFALKCLAASGRYRFRENYAVYLSALMLAVFTATGKKDIFGLQGWLGWFRVLVGEFILIYLALN